jgi:hypothetical protein
MLLPPAMDPHALIPNVQHPNFYLYEDIPPAGSVSLPTPTPSPTSSYLGDSCLEYLILESIPSETEISSLEVSSTSSSSTSPYLESSDLVYVPSNTNNESNPSDTEVSTLEFSPTSSYLETGDFIYDPSNTNDKNNPTSDAEMDTFGEWEAIPPLNLLLVNLAMNYGT